MLLSKPDPIIQEPHIITNDKPADPTNPRRITYNIKKIREKIRECGTDTHGIPTEPMPLYE